MSILKVALEVIAKKNSVGEVSDDLLMKACENFKIKSDFLDDYEYNVKVAKSFYDYIQKSKPDDEILKAVLPGQTKVVDGVVYIYTATPNAKTDFDWRILKTTRKVGKQVPDDKVDAKQVFVNSLFPGKLSDLKVVSTSIGGSTGAVLVEDKNGDQYVMKKGTNTSNEHVKSEYIASQMYHICGLRVPDMELYDDNGTTVLLSKFVIGAKMPDSSHHAEMAKGFAVDALLANWDIYMNDNCLVDIAGRVVRVDNGGSLEYRAQGSTNGKNWGAKVNEWTSMLNHNSTVLGSLSEQDKMDQLEALLNKREDIVGLAEELGDKNLSKTLEKRLDYLKGIKDKYDSKQAKRNGVLPTRTILPDDLMYRDLDDDTLNDILVNTPGSNFADKIDGGGTDGRPLLEAICKERGFDGLPKVVHDQEYWNEVAKNPLNQLIRGVGQGNNDPDDYTDQFKFGSCYFGGYNLALYGAGIYFHQNNGSDKDYHTSADYKKSTAWQNARGYGSEIIDACLSSDAKMIDYDKAITGMKAVGNHIDPKEKAKIKILDKEVAELHDEILTLKSDLNNLTAKVENDVKVKMNWNENALKLVTDGLDNVFWGAVDADGDPDYLKYEEYLTQFINPIIKDNGGTITEKKANSGVYVVTLPNTRETFMVSKYSYENNAIKRKNAFTPAFSYPAKLFQDFVIKNHYEVISKKITQESEGIGDISKTIMHDINIKSSIANDKLNEITAIQATASKAKLGNPDTDFRSALYQSRGTQAVGVWAAANGYDAIHVPRHHSGAGNDYVVVLNRTKIIVKI